MRVRRGQASHRCPSYTTQKTPIQPIPQGESCITPSPAPLWTYRKSLYCTPPHSLPPRIRARHGYPTTPISTSLAKPLAVSSDFRDDRGAIAFLTHAQDRSHDPLCAFVPLDSAAGMSYCQTSSLPMTTATSCEGYAKPLGIVRPLSWF